MFFKIGVLKKRLQHRCFPVNIAILLRTAFYKTPLVAASVVSILTKKGPY